MPVPPLYDIVPPPGAAVFAGCGVGVAVGVTGLVLEPDDPTAEGTLAGGGRALGVSGAVGVGVGVSGVAVAVGGAGVGVSVGAGSGGGSTSTEPRLAASAWAAAACVTASVGLNVTGVDADAAVSGGAPVAASGTAETIRVRGGTAASGTGVGTLMSPRVTTIKPALPMTKSTAAISNGIDRLIGS